MKRYCGMHWVRTDGTDVSAHADPATDDVYLRLKAGDDQVTLTDAPEALLDLLDRCRQTVEAAAGDGARAAARKRMMAAGRIGRGGGCAA